MKKLIPILLAAVLLVGCSAPGVNDGTMSRDNLRAIAFEHAGVNEADAYDIDEDFDREGRQTYYELDFEVSGIEYEYVLNAHTGQIVRNSPDKKPAPQIHTEPEPEYIEPQPITEEEAIQIALEHAGLNTGAVKSISATLDYEDGEYEIDFYAKGTEYDYEINAYTGQVISAEKDRD